MVRSYWHTIYVDRDTYHPDKGWGWVEVKLEDLQRFGIPQRHTATKLRFVRVFRGRTAAKKLTLNIAGDLVTLRAQKSLTIEAIIAWVRTWAPPNTKIISPGNRTHSLDGDKLAHQAHFIYFILNEDSNAIKIGRATNVVKRLKALQTSSPAKLKLIKSLQVEGAKEAQALEQSLHQQFSDLRVTGEWFKAETKLLEYIRHPLVDNL